MLIDALENTLKDYGWHSDGTTGEGLPMFSKEGQGVVVIEDTGWEHVDDEGKSLDFGSSVMDLAQYLSNVGVARELKSKPKSDWVTDITVDPDQMLNDQDKDWLKKMRIKSSLLKKGYGLTNEGQKDAVCPNCHQPIGDGEMVNYTQSGMEAHVQCPPATGQQQGQQAPGWQSRLNLPAGYKPPAQAQAPAPAKQPGMISPNVGRPRASLIARINNLDRKTALFGETSHHHFSFEVPMKAGGTVAFHLAKAGLEDFEANNYREEGTTEFAFKSEPEMHIAEEIVRAEFAREIESKHGGWGSWAPKAEDPSMVKAPNEVEKQHLMSSDKTAEDPNSYLRGKRVSGPQAVPSRYEEALEQALSALQTLAEVGPSEDVRGCAAMSAGDLKQFADDALAGKARHFSSADTPCCCVLGHLAFTKKRA